MIAKAKKFLKNNKFLGDSFVVLLGSGIISFLNYLYHFLSGNKLSPQDYGLLESLIVLTYFLSVLTQSFSLAVINLVAKANTTLILPIINCLEKQALKLSFIFWFLVLIIYPFFKSFLHLPNFSIYFIFSLQVLLWFPLTTYSSVLQSRLKFISFSLTGIFQSLTKNAWALILITLGWQAKGAIGGLVISSLIGLIISRYFVKKYWQKEQGDKSIPYKLTRSFWRFSSLSLITSLCLTSIYSIDIVLVRHYFPDFQSGIYAAVSVLGKIIFFGSTTILLVAYPLFVKYKNSFNKLRQVFTFTFLTLTSLSFFGLLIFRLYPNLIVKLLYGTNYHEAVLLIPHYAVFITLFALLTGLIQFLLALENKWAVLITLTTCLLQIFSIVYKHNDLTTIINNSIFSVFIGLILGSFIVIRVINLKLSYE